MTPWKQIYDIQGCVFILLLLLDYVLTAYTKMRYPFLNSPYYAIHRRFGFVKVCVTKTIIAILILSRLWIMGVGPAASMVLLICVYGYYITRLLLDLVRTRGAGNSELKR